MLQQSLFICTLFGMCNSYSFVYEYAPQIYLAKNELYNPSSVDFFANYTYLNKTTNTLWTKTPLRYPTDIQPFFHGQNISQVPVYSLVLPLDNETDPIGVYQNPCNNSLVVTYFVFYPYNLGKEFFDIMWDNHVGDWEHIHIYFRLCKPYKIVVSYHRWNTTKNWGDSSVEIYNSTHPVVYSAYGSHGFWFTQGKHLYYINPNFYDITSKGQVYNTWNNVEVITPYDWNSYKINDVSLITDIWRWGNPSNIFNDNCFFGYCRFSDGPTGMLNKDLIQRILQNLKNRGYICDQGCLWNSGIY